MQYIIIGSDGYIGSYLYEHLLMERESVLGTTRRPEEVGKKLFFDIKDNNADSLPDFDWQNTTVIICTAQSKIDKCVDDYRSVYALNVTHTVGLAAELLSKGAQVIVFSSDQVFDGQTGGYKEDDKVSPMNAYGRMKAEMEQKLLALKPQPCVFRIAKTLSRGRTANNVFTEWENTPSGGIVRCIAGNIISFVYIEDIYRAIKVAAQNRLLGLFNIAGDDICSRAELAREFMTVVGRKDVIIKEEPVENFNFREPRPLNVTMNNAKFKQATGFYYTPLRDVIKMYVARLQNESIQK